MRLWCLFFSLSCAFGRTEFQATRILRRERAAAVDDGRGSGAVEKQTLEEPRGAILYLYKTGREEEFKTSLLSVCRNLVGAYPILAVHGSKVKQEMRKLITDYYHSISPTCLEPNRTLEWVDSAKHDPDGSFVLDTTEEGYHTKARRLYDDVLNKKFRRPSRDGALKVKARPQSRRPLPSSARHPLRVHPSSRPLSLLETGLGDYKAMIAFWLFDVFELAHQRGFEYLMRLDTDSILDTQPKEDPFRVVRDNHAVYGYRAFCFDHQNNTGTMRKRLSEFVEKEKIKPAFRGFQLNASGAAPMVYTNFEVTYVPFFRRSDVQKFARSMLHETATSRLGDAVVRALQLGLFANESQVIHLHDFRYRHGCDRWWWILNKTTDCAIEEDDPFVMDWEMEPDRFGPPVGHCYSSRLDPERVAAQSIAQSPRHKKTGQAQVPHRTRIKVQLSGTKRRQRPTHRKFHRR